jgi:hypothetical protein
MQPLERVDGAVRFRPNRIVLQMLAICRAHSHGLNEILLGEYSQGDLDQFYQLIGYSLDCYEELSFTTATSVADARQQAQILGLEKPPVKGKETHG